MTAIACPHCSAPNVAGSTFCEACGKALPAAAGSGPRLVTGSTFASTGAGQKLQGDELHKQLRRASGALLAVAIIQTLAGLLMVGVLQAAPPGRTKVDPTTLYVVLFGVAILFWGGT